jgi:hypothetical protein
VRSRRAISSSSRSARLLALTGLAAQIGQLRLLRAEVPRRLIEQLLERWPLFFERLRARAPAAQLGLANLEMCQAGVQIRALALQGPDLFRLQLALRLDLRQPRTHGGQLRFDRIGASGQRVAGGRQRVELELLAGRQPAR